MDLSNEELAQSIQNGVNVQACLELLYTRNRPIIRNIAKKYECFIDLEDSLQSAYFGLMDAVERFDETKGNFLHILCLCVSRAIRLEVQKSRNISQDMLTKTNKYRKTVAELEQELFREPTIKEIAWRMGLSQSEVEIVRMYISGDYSLDSTAESAEGSECTLADTLEADSSPETDAIEDYCTEDVKGVIWQYCKDVLAPREYEIIRQYYKDGKTLKQIAEEQGITTQRIDEIKKKGINGLQNSPQKRQLMQRLEIVESRERATSFKSFCDNKFTARPEIIALIRYELKEKFR